MNSATATLTPPTLTQAQLNVMRYLVHLAKGGYLEATLDGVADLLGRDARGAVHALAECGYVTVTAPRVWLTAAGRQLGGLS